MAFYNNDKNKFIINKVAGEEEYTDPIYVNAITVNKVVNIDGDNVVQAEGITSIKKINVNPQNVPIIEKQIEAAGDDKTLIKNLKRKKKYHEEKEKEIENYKKYMYISEAKEGLDKEEDIDPETGLAQRSSATQPTLIKNTAGDDVVAFKNTFVEFKKSVQNDGYSNDKNCYFFICKECLYSSFDVDAKKIVKHIADHHGSQGKKSDFYLKLEFSCDLKKLLAEKDEIIRNGGKDKERLDNIKKDLLGRVTNKKNEGFTEHTKTVDGVTIKYFICDVCQQYYDLIHTNQMYPNEEDKPTEYKTRDSVKKHIKNKHPQGEEGKENKKNKECVNEIKKEITRVGLADGEDRVDMVMGGELKGLTFKNKDAWKKALSSSAASMTIKNNNKKLNEKMSVVYNTDITKIPQQARNLYKKVEELQEEDRNKKFLERKRRNLGVILTDEQQKIQDALIRDARRWKEEGEVRKGKERWEREVKEELKKREEEAKKKKAMWEREIKELIKKKEEQEKKNIIINKYETKVRNTGYGNININDFKIIKDYNADEEEPQGIDKLIKKQEEINELNKIKKEREEEEEYLENIFKEKEKEKEKYREKRRRIREEKIYLGKKLNDSDLSSLSSIKLDERSRTVKAKVVPKKGKKEVPARTPPSSVYSDSSCDDAAPSPERLRKGLQPPKK